MTVYLDNDFKCHVTDDGTMTPYDTDFFDGRCKTYIESFRIVPEGAIWIRKDGTVFGPQGTMISPWKEGYKEAQAGYEDSLREAALAYQEGVNSI